ncbi:MAG: ATPase [Chloroflexota bacterium]
MRDRDLDEFYDDDEPGPEEDDDILYLIDRLEELVGVGKRVPFSTRVMVEEEEFIAILDQLRIAVPAEVGRAQRVIKEREAIIGNAQDEAARMLDAARQQAEYVVSQQGVLNEARQRGEELLRQVEAEHRRSVAQIDEYAMRQFTRVEDAIQEGMRLIMDAVGQAGGEMDSAKRHIGR